MKPKIIVIDGIDGSGKQTQIEALTQYLKQKGFKVLNTSFPRYNSEASFFVRSYLNGDYGKDANSINPYQASTFYALDRMDFFKKDLSEYDYLLFDRYTTSNMIHQAQKIQDKEKRDEYINWLKELEYHVLEIPKPDHVFFLDVPPNVTRDLIENRHLKRDIHEANKEHQQKAYKNAIEIAQKEDWKIINCLENDNLKSKDKITQELIKNLNV